MFEEWLYTAMGVLVAMAIATMKVDNPAGVPWVAVVRRSAPALLSTFVVSFLISTAFYRLLPGGLTAYLGVKFQHSMSFFIAMAPLALIGAVPQLRNPEFARRFKFFSRLLQTVYRWFFGMFQDSVNREERKAEMDILTSHSPEPINMLYELLLLQISSVVGKERKSRKHALAAQTTRDLGMKNCALHRYHGSAKAYRAALAAMSDRSEACFHNWRGWENRTNASRRKATSDSVEAERRVLSPGGRRKYDHLPVLW